MTLRRSDVFLASFVGFVAWGLLVQQVSVLRFLGYAFISGFLIALALVLLIIITSSRSKHERTAYQSSQRPSAAFLSPKLWHTESIALARSRVYKPSQLYPASFVISQALDNLINLALREFVSSWYGNITNS